MLTLYDRERSGNCYRVRLMLALLRLPYKKILVTRSGKGNNELPPGFLDISPRRQIPVLLVGDRAIWDSHAILVYLAREHGDRGWLPLPSKVMSQVMQWIALNLNEGTYGLARARSIRGQRRDGSLKDTQAIAKVALETLNRRLRESAWLATYDVPTIADIACYPYVAMAPEAGISLGPYEGVKRWIGRIQALPGYIELPAYDGKGGPIAE